MKLLGIVGSLVWEMENGIILIIHADYFSLFNLGLLFPDS